MTSNLLKPYVLFPPFLIHRPNPSCPLRAQSPFRETQSSKPPNTQECTSLELGLAPLRRACETLTLKFRSEEEDLSRLAEIWASYRPTDGRPSSLRAGALRDFRKGYFRKVVQDSEERVPRYKRTVAVSPRTQWRGRWGKR
jgi:hypothetical protein